MNDNIYDVIIIGSGPAGLTAAIYAARAKLKTLIIEKNTPGGQLINISKLENYPGYDKLDGASLAYVMYQQVNELNVEFVFDEVINVEVNDNLKKVLTPSTSYVSKNIIVATGTTYQNLKVPNEKKYIGNGISYCAICDGKLYNNKVVACIASSNHSLKETLYLANYSSKIFLIVNEDISNSIYYDEVRNCKKIEIILDAKITKLIGNNSLEAIEITFKDKSLRILNVQGIFVLNTSLPSNSFLSKYDIFSSSGYMKVNQFFETSIPGIYGIGDVVDKELKQVVTATSDGALAAYHIISKRGK